MMVDVLAFLYSSPLVVQPAVALVKRAGPELKMRDNLIFVVQ